MKRLIILLITMVLLATACGGMSKKKIAQLKEDGMQYLAEGDYQNAVDALTKVIDYDDENNSVAFALAEAYAGLEEFNRAIKTLEKIKSGDQEKIAKITTLYKGSSLVKDVAIVDWDTYKDVDWDFVGSFNEDYSRYGVAGLYGLLDLTYDVALEANYADILIWNGPYSGLITAYRTEKEAITNDYSKMVLFDGYLKETNKKFSKKSWGSGLPPKPFIDIFNGNTLVYAEEYSTEHGKKTIARPVIGLEEDTIVAGALREEKGDNISFKFVDEFFLVNKKDLSVHKLMGKAQDHFYGYYSDYSIVGDMITVIDKGKCGYYNLNAILVSPFQYDAHEQANHEFRCSNYSYGYVVVKENNQYGMIDKNGDVVVKTEFDGITEVAYGKFLIIYKGNVGLASLKGRKDE